MDNTDPVTPDSVEELTFWDQHRFLLMILLAVILAMVLTFISMAMYYSSGASQLDLSRPGYQGISDKVDRDDSAFKNYSSTGPIDQASINEFRDLYQTQSTKTKSVDAFSGDPLSATALGINQ